MSEPKVAVVVVNFGSSALIERNLPFSTTSKDITVLVDSWSTPEERTVVRELSEKHGWILETPDYNTGFAGGMNIGVARARQAGATALLLLNPDARLSPQDRTRLIERVITDTTLLIAPRVVRPDGTPWMSALMDLHLGDGKVASSLKRRPGVAAMPWVSGAVVALSTELWERIHGLDEDYFLYWEDIDMCRRVRDAGGRVEVDPDVVAVHDEGGTQARRNARAKSEAYYYYNIRNRAIFAEKWLSPAERRRWLAATPRTAWATMLTGGRRQFLHGLEPWRAFIRGVGAAYSIGIAGQRNSRIADQSHRPYASRAASTIKVLESFSQPGKLTNPYITQLYESLHATPGLEVKCWTWSTALTGSYDIFHTHWTEALIEPRNLFTTAVRRFAFAIFLARLQATRTPIVRTVHNVDLPNGLSATEMMLLQRTDNLTTARVVLNNLTPLPPGSVFRLIPHGHYRDWFRNFTKADTVADRMVFVGKIRRYKNVEGLVRAFSALPVNLDTLSLHINGRPSSNYLTETLTQLASLDSRIELDLSFIDDRKFVREVSESELVVLPYNEMHNSGTVLAALSLDRPVLVPDNEFNRVLATEVGSGWVVMFKGELTAQHLLHALDEVRSSKRSTRPDLSARDWSCAGSDHLELFRQALEIAHGPRP